MSKRPQPDDPDTTKRTKTIHVLSANDILTFTDLVVFIQTSQPDALCQYMHDLDIQGTIPIQLISHTYSTRCHTPEWVAGMFVYINNTPSHVNRTSYIINICSHAAETRADQFIVHTLAYLHQHYPGIITQLPPRIMAAYVAGDADTFSNNIYAHVHLIRHIFHTYADVYVSDYIFYQTHAALYMSRNTTPHFISCIDHFVDTVASTDRIPVFGSLRTMMSNPVFKDHGYLAFLITRYIHTPEQRTVCANALPPTLTHIKHMFY